VNVGYSKYLLSDHWRSFRLSVLAVRPTCEVCYSDKASQVHHLSYANLWAESHDDVQPLCRSCHAATHGKWGELLGVGGDALVQRCVDVLISNKLYVEAKYCWQCGGAWEKHVSGGFRMQHNPECPIAIAHGKHGSPETSP
jgi:hypothetical protein